MSQLPHVTDSTGRNWYVDARLREFRSVNNPHDRIRFPGIPGNGRPTPTGSRAEPTDALEPETSPLAVERRLDHLEELSQANADAVSARPTIAQVDNLVNNMTQAHYEEHHRPKG